MNNFLILSGQDLMNFANFTLNRAKVGMQKNDVLQFVKWMANWDWQKVSLTPF